MMALFKKEWRLLISSLSLMIAFVVYFLLMGIWLWFLPQSSILQNKFATLQILFDITPWLFIIIIPALTMRTIADEKSSGTIDLLLSKPISFWQIVCAKFLAVLSLMAIILLLSQVYTFSIYVLSSPTGNIDLAGTTGSYLGWFLLASAFIAISILASAMSHSQMIAFLAGTFLCFMAYELPSMLSSVSILNGDFGYGVEWIGLQFHYAALSKGVIYYSDVLFFIAIILIFLLLAIIYLERPTSSVRKLRNYIKKYKLLIGLILVCLIGALWFNGKMDLTEDKRFTLNPESKSLIRGVTDIVYVDVLMDGAFPAAFKRLQNAALEKLEECNKLNRNIIFHVQDPLKGDAEVIKSNQEELRGLGLAPTQLTVFQNNQQEKKLIYPYAIFHFGERSIPVNLLEAQDPGTSEDEILNRSVALLEYKFINAIQKLRMTKNPVVVFTKGHGELTTIQTADLERTLRPVYSTGRITLDSVTHISTEISILIVAKPQSPFSLRDLFLIDQYIMNGGKVMWYIDPLRVNTDTVNLTNRNKVDFVPLPYQLNLEEIFFKYGFRIQPNMILDYECSTIPLLTGYNGGNPQFAPRPWYFHPLLIAENTHNIVNNLDRVLTYYPATIDTLKSKSALSKTILLKSSQVSRTQTSPSPINFELVRQDITPEQFKNGQQPVAILIEGTFNSAFENRVGSSFNEILKNLGRAFKASSPSTKMMVFSDGDLIANAISARGEPAPLGFNIYEQKTYPANKTLALNSIEYMLDENQLMNVRNKQIKLRLLDEAKIAQGRSKWIWINILTPIFCSIFIFGVTNWWRKRKYATN